MPKLSPTANSGPGWTGVGKPFEGQALILRSTRGSLTQIWESYHPNSEFVRVECLSGTVPPHRGRK